MFNVFGNENGTLYVKLIGIELPEYNTGPPSINV